MGNVASAWAQSTLTTALGERMGVWGVRRQATGGLGGRGRGGAEVIAVHCEWYTLARDAFSGPALIPEQAPGSAPLRGKRPPSKCTRAPP